MCNLCVANPQKTRRLVGILALLALIAAVLAVGGCGSHSLLGHEEPTRSVLIGSGGVSGYKDGMTVQRSSDGSYFVTSPPAGYTSGYNGFYGSYGWGRSRVRAVLSDGPGALYPSAGYGWGW